MLEDSMQIETISSREMAASSKNDFRFLFPVQECGVVILTLKDTGYYPAGRSQF
jgi:hypothetical protein